MSHVIYLIFQLYEFYSTFPGTLLADLVYFQISRNIIVEAHLEKSKFVDYSGKNITCFKDYVDILYSEVGAIGMFV